VQSDDGILKTVTPAIAKEIVTLEKQRLSITLRYLATGSNFKDVCFLLGNSPESEVYMPTFWNTLSVPSS